MAERGVLVMVYRHSFCTSSIDLLNWSVEIDEPSTDTLMAPNSPRQTELFGEFADKTELRHLI